MPIQIRCTCQQILAVEEAHQGQVVGCPYCGTQLTVPVMQHAPPGYAPPPSGYPQQPPQNPSAPGFSPQGFPSQQPPGQPGWQNSFPPTAPGPAASSNPFGGSAPDTSNPFASSSSGGGSSGNPFAAPQAPAYPTPAGPTFAGAPAPTFPSNPTPSFPTPTAAGPVNNAPSMPFLAMDVPAKSGPSLHDISRGAKAQGDWEAAAEPMIWHIPCPNGHLLETPEELLDQEVLCPFCKTQFLLEQSQSVEAKEQAERERAIREEQAGQLWLKWAIGIAVVVLLGLGAMIAISASK